MYNLPTEVTIGDQTLHIRNNGDFRMVLGCLEILQDLDLTEQERIFTALIVFYSEINELEDLNNIVDLREAVHEMYKFFNCGDEEDPSVQHQPKPRLIDWDKDSTLICAAVNTVAGKEVRAESYIHWWTFMGYYMSIGESSLSTVVSIRSKILKGKKLEKYEQEYRRDNPQYFIWNSKTLEEMEADKFLAEVWNKG